MLKIVSFGQKCCCLDQVVAMQNNRPRSVKCLRGCFLDFSWELFVWIEKQAEKYLICLRGDSAEAASAIQVTMKSEWMLTLAHSKGQLPIKERCSFYVFPSLLCAYRRLFDMLMAYFMASTSWGSLQLLRHEKTSPFILLDVLPHFELK